MRKTDSDRDFGAISTENNQQKEKEYLSGIFGVAVGAGHGDLASRLELVTSGGQWAQEGILQFLLELSSVLAGSAVSPEQSIVSTALTFFGGLSEICSLCSEFLSSGFRFSIGEHLGGK